MDDTNTPSQRQKRSRDASEHDDAWGTGAARGLPRRAVGIVVDATVVADEREETFFEVDDEEDTEEEVVFMEAEDAFLEDEEEAFMPHEMPYAYAPLEIDFLCVCPSDSDDGATAAGRSSAADQDPVDATLNPGMPPPSFAAGRHADTVDATLRLGLGPPSAAPVVPAAASAEDIGHGLQFHGGVPSGASPGPIKFLDVDFCGYLFDADPCHAPPPSPATPKDSASTPDDAADRPSTGLDLNLPVCFPDDDLAEDVHERPAVTAEQSHRSPTPCTSLTL